MDFKRARGQEQKNIRIQQIIDITAELYGEIGYDKVTFTKIGERLELTRNILYHYISCKEDIFLLILRQDIEKMVADAEKTFTSHCKDIDEFIEKWAAFVGRQQRMLTLFSIVNTIILRGATRQAYIDYRTHIFACFNRLGRSAQIALPALKGDKTVKFIELQNSYAMTLYPASIEYKRANNIAVFETVGFGTRSFIPQYEMYLKIVIKGLLC